MSNNAAYVTTGKPKTAGAIYRAPVGTTLPTDAVSDLATAFQALGYASDDGLTNDNSPESESVQAWGGDTVLRTQTSKDDQFGFTLIEAMNIYVLKTIYGEDNVSGDLSSGIVIKANADEAEYYSWVFDMILKGGILKRVVVPQASVTAVGTITYKDNEAVGYETTLGCIPDSEGNTHYEYIQEPSLSEDSSSS